MSFASTIWEVNVDSLMMNGLLVALSPHPPLSLRLSNPLASPEVSRSPDCHQRRTLSGRDIAAYSKEIRRKQGWVAVEMERHERDTAGSKKSGAVSVTALPQPRATTVNLHLQEWIDGNIVHSSAQSETEIGITEKYFRSCLSVFKQLWGFILQRSELLDRSEKRAAKESLSRLVLWIDTFEPGRLDRILNKSEDLRENILDLITKIANPLIHKVLPLVLPLAQGESVKPGSSLQDTPEEELRYSARELQCLAEKVQSTILENQPDDCDSDSSLHENSDAAKWAFPRILSASKGLMELLPSLERSEMIPKKETKIDTMPRSSFRVSEPASFFVSRIIDKFRNADIRLAARLGEANWQRHVRIRRQVESSTTTEGGDPPAAHFVFQPFSMFYDSGIGTSKPVTSSYAISDTSHASFFTSVEERSRGALRVPETPAEVGLEKPFQCGICGHTLSKIKSRIDWKIHVFADLQPYICTWPDCNDNLRTFPTRKLWSNHEFDYHRTEKFWRCYECSTDMPSATALKKHLQNEHQTILSEVQLAMATSLAEVKRPMSFKDMKCPLCLSLPGNTRRAFETHVGKHMEEIALASLPRDGSDDSAEKSKVSNDTGGSISHRPDDVTQPSLPTDLALPLPALQPLSQPASSSLPELRCSKPKCGCAFHSIEDLQAHYRLHPTSRDYPCPYPNCDKAFVRKSDLSRHSKIHEPKPRTFHCSVPSCPHARDRPFYCRDNLLLHEFRAHGMCKRTDLSYTGGLDGADESYEQEQAQTQGGEEQGKPSVSDTIEGYVARIEEYAASFAQGICSGQRSNASMLQNVEGMRVLHSLELESFSEEEESFFEEEE